MAVSKKKTKNKSSASKKATVKKSSAKKVSARKNTSNQKKAVSKSNQPEEAKNDEKVQEKQLKLRPIMVINDANSMHAGLLKFIEADTNIVIDASSVEMIDTAIFQLLMSFIDQVRTNNKYIKWNSPSEEFCSRAMILGLTDDLGIGEVCS